MSITLVLPFGDQEAAEPAMARGEPRRPTARVMRTSPVLGLIDNGKLKADVLLTAVAEALKARGGIGDYFVQRKSPSATLPDADCEAIAQRADIVISGLGDCGGCTACSTIDALRCCAGGALTFMLASEKFAFLVEATEREYGIAGLNRLYVEHPVWNRSEQWFAAIAETLADRIMDVMRGEERHVGEVVTISESGLEAALADLRSGMDADGYDMALQIRESGVRIDVLAREGAGVLCLMPKANFAQLVASTLKRAGVPAEQVEITYPAGA